MEKKISATMTEINGTLLVNAFKKRELNMAEISEQFGYSRNYLAACVRHNAIRTSFAELLWNEYNIPLDEYSVEQLDSSENPESVKKFGTTKAEADNEELYNTIRRAVADGFNDIQTGLYAACYGAFKKALKETTGGQRYGTNR